MKTGMVWLLRLPPDFIMLGEIRIVFQKHHMLGYTFHVKDLATLAKYKNPCVERLI